MVNTNELQQNLGFAKALFEQWLINNNSSAETFNSLSAGENSKDL